jgi:hypothetical protein
MANNYMASALSGKQEEGTIVAQSVAQETTTSIIKSLSNIAFTIMKTYRVFFVWITLIR